MTFHERRKRFVTGLEAVTVNLASTQGRHKRILRRVPLFASAAFCDRPGMKCVPKESQQTVGVPDQSRRSLRFVTALEQVFCVVHGMSQKLKTGQT